MRSGEHRSGVSFNCLVIHSYNEVLLTLEGDRNGPTGKGQKSRFRQCQRSEASTGRVTWCRGHSIPPGAQGGGTCIPEGLTHPGAGRGRGGPVCFEEASPVIVSSGPAGPLCVKRSCPGAGRVSTLGPLHCVLAFFF